jgi:Na+/H+ antiporter NhaD/arsenite permease-like protein
MITQSELYWITRLGYINGLVLGLAIIMTFAIALCVVYFFIAEEENRYTYDNKKIDKYNSIRGIYICWFFALFLWVAFILTPNTKEMCMIKVIPMLTNSEMVQQLSKDGKEIYTLGINRIKEELTGDRK